MEDGGKCAHLHPLLHHLPPFLTVLPLEQEGSVWAAPQFELLGLDLQRGPKHLPLDLLVRRHTYVGRWASPFVAQLAAAPWELFSLVPCTQIGIISGATKY